ncbi:ankyrin repeat-containing domain protein [Xylaria cf. heliscus]|nr:ankyrin repeat-containing domain protein [Xylaria cf. heliscus]
MSSITINGLEEAIMAGDLGTIQNLYTIANSDQKAALLTLIAERAARNTKTEILEWCFRSGLEIPRSSLNNELYDQACFSLSPAIFAVLLAHGLDLNGYHSEHVGDALSLSAYYGNIELARFLLEKGADPNQAWGYQEHEAGVWAIVGPSPSAEILRLMLQYGWTQKESTAHIAAAEVGNLEALKLLVEADHGADLEHSEPWWGVPTENEEDRCGTALYRAALKGKEESVAYLLEKGANPGFEDKMGRSCFWAAREGGNERVMQLLEQND